MMALDAARGLAVIGMIAVNTGPRGDNGLLEMLYRVPYGRASLLFVLLGGIGISLMTRRARERQTPLPWGSLLWRCLLLLLGGLALQELDHDVAVILQIYGLLILLAIPLLKSSKRTLLLVMGLSALLGPVLWIATQPQIDGRVYRGPVSASEPPGEMLVGIVLTGPYPLLVWIAPFVLGVWLGRQQLTEPRVSTRLMIWGVSSAVGARLVSVLLVGVFGEPTSHIVWQRLFSAVAHSQMPLWLISGTGSAVFVLGVCLKIQTWSRSVWSPLIFLGQLALTAYVGHLVILAFVVRPGPETLGQGMIATTGTVAVLMVFAWLWRKRFTRGPLEMVLRAPKLQRRSR
ncbi:DUF418 domain-containing protein [Nesterenkonia sp. HG001]|uniref:DUF418 domain-containing protein n=1 Tax=Nesterenkonia sp. HG001 TaxID=2983207 RepID=UPI002AC6B87C|nr:DUF418 domain-containing protein [Nesterenkonia sp. HG001]MDZ5077828.1 DUF418 domain-containing protein [Nesterenkonia sp. HG001]